MIVCLCKAVSDKRIKQVVAQGVCTLSDVQKKTGAGTSCKSCHEDIQKLIDEGKKS
jgi:bacterioferritin-associated ferredoxin